MTVAEPQPAVAKPSIRWHYLTPDRVVLGFCPQTLQENRLPDEYAIMNLLGLHHETHK